MKIAKKISLIVAIALIAAGLLLALAALALLRFDITALRLPQTEGCFLLAPSVFKRRELPEHIAEYGIAVNEIGAFYKVPVPVRAEGV